MKTKSLRLKHKPTRVVVVLALLLTFAGVGGGSARLAGEGPAPEAAKTPPGGAPGFTPESVPSNGPGSEAGEPTRGTPAFDSDVLDIEGEWAVTQRAPAGTRLEGGYWVPSGVDPPWVYRISLRRIGPNAYGGSAFRGQLIGAPAVRIHGDTFYGGRGVQLMQMRFEEETSAGRYYKLFCGKHQLYKSDPKRAEVLGGWVDGGSEGAASGYDGSFVMVKGSR